MCKAFLTYQIFNFLKPIRWKTPAISKILTTYLNKAVWH